MLNRSASLPMSLSVLKALPGKLDIKRHLPSILYLFIWQLFQIHHQLSIRTFGKHVYGHMRKGTTFQVTQLMY